MTGLEPARSLWKSEMLTIEHHIPERPAEFSEVAGP
jgi:hypothetical protein